MAIRPANDPFDDDERPTDVERATVWVLLSGGVGLLWFLGWLLTL